VSLNIDVWAYVAHYRDCIEPDEYTACDCREIRGEVMKMADEKVELPDPGPEVAEATQNFLDKWTKRYSHTVVGKVLSFFGFGK
jgi:hypothetical protein